MLSAASKGLGRAGLIARRKADQLSVLSTTSLHPTRRHKTSSSQASDESYQYPLNEVGDVRGTKERITEVINFPSGKGVETPLLLNAQEHVVGYLSKILNARVYEAAIETELQEAKNLSMVRINKFFCDVICVSLYSTKA
jgi:hypothetical protein